MVYRCAVVFFCVVVVFMSHLLGCVAHACLCQEKIIRRCLVLFILAANSMNRCKVLASILVFAVVRWFAVSACVSC